MITGTFSSTVGSDFAHDWGDKEGGGGEGGDWMGGGGGKGEDMDNFRGASLPRCLEIEEGGGFGVGSD